uniref:Putative nucleotide biding protein n=1 Tax=Saccharum hybrid cultivar R570 TaxID=131158 RepID=A0A059Q2N6_9POAL|nr:putative nucleotide biding protein [Saccharum hybrid cultivar R570]
MAATGKGESGEREGKEGKPRAVCVAPRTQPLVFSWEAYGIRGTYVLISAYLIYYFSRALQKEGGEEKSVKLFVGQVPKHMTEADLLAMFREVAAVDEVTVIKDKVTKVSRGADLPGHGSGLATLLSLA